MRILRINDIIADIDDETALGITLQSYDIKDVANTFVNVSNTFSIPRTSKNLSLFGNPQDAQSTNTKIYELSTVEYWIDNEQFLRNAKVKVTEINERINLFIYQKDTVWDELKSLDWPTLGSELITWLQDTGSLPSVTNQYTGTYADLITGYTTATEGIVLPFYNGNLYNQEFTLSGFTYALETSNSILLDDNRGTTKYKGGHFCIYIKTIFEFFEYKYGVSFSTSGSSLTGNIFNDAIASKMVIPIRDLVLQKDTGYYFRFAPTILQVPFVYSYFYPFTDVEDKPDKTASDFVNAFINHFNLIKDEFYIDDVYTVRFARFDDLETLADVVDFSSLISRVNTFKPTIEGYAQNTYIKFAEVYPGGSEYSNSKLLTVQNKNIDITTDLFEIDGYVPNLTESFYLDLSLIESFSTFVFIELSETTESKNVIFLPNGTILGESTAADMFIAKLYNLDDEYNFLNEAISYPKYYEVEKWLRISDLKDFEFFKQYYIRELNGSFFINKISGFNPEKSKQATTIELLKISNRTPNPSGDTFFWVDGVDDIFADGSGDYFY